MADDNDQLLAFLGVTAKSSEQVEKEVIGQALHTTSDAAADGAADGGSTAKVQSALDTVTLEIEALKAALQPNTDGQDGEQQDGDEDEDEEAAEKSGRVEDRALRSATMQQRLQELQEQQQQLQTQLQQAEEEEQAGGKAADPGIEDDNLFEQLGSGTSRMVETSRDKSVRLGLLTPFDNLQGFERNVTSTRPRRPAQPVVNDTDATGLDPNASQLLKRMGEKTVEAVTNRHSAVLLNMGDVPTPERAVRQMNPTFWRDAASSKSAPASKKRRASTLPRRHKSGKTTSKAMTPGSTGSGAKKKTGKKRKRRKASGSDEEDESSEYVPSEEGEEDDDNTADEEFDDSALESDDHLDQSGDEGIKDTEFEFDDADENFFTRRSKRLLAMPDQPEGEDELEEEVVFDGGFKVPGGIYHRLFDYQKTGVKWLWELYCQRAGGIMGDEMGLGKTIQVIAFLAGLHHSGMFRPSLVICPATVLRQWLRELRTWYPPFRVLLFHDSARSPEGARPSRDDLVDIAYRSETSVVVTTYDQLRIHREALLGVHWGVAVLDEGHKIRNPDSEITLVCKRILTVHRIIMSGSPIQNRLAELWSLFDFIFPGKLGTLPVFQAQFAIPIQIGGYANANQLQVSTAFKCAVILRDLITPYLLRRRKVDVNANLPKKTEQVLFCTLTKEQRELYRAYLNSPDVSEILEGRRRALQGIDVLRKICNHPDILERSKADVIADYGNPSRSGKLVVTEKLLTHWKEGGSKALVFSQTQQMLEILEQLVLRKGWRYHRMDGSTAIVQRARLVDDFNNNPDVFCFLLTTKVGGLGVNLTGADKVLLYDPDWNPATDSQARERAWRIGQTRQVTVFRLITSGTIEEKVYHRQIYKNFLTNKVLRDPRQKRFFTARDITDLFTLADENANNETANIFGSVEQEVTLAPVNPKARMKEKQKSRSRGGSGKDSKRGRGSKATREEPEAEEGQGEGEDGQGKDETKLLRDLFEGTGIRSLMNHDKIEGANDPEVVAMHQEAAKMARKAAEALRNSRQACMTASINIPTWTGRHGAAGAPPPAPAPKKRFGTVVNPRLVQPSVASSAVPSTPAIPGLISRPGMGLKPGSRAGGPGSGIAHTAHTASTAQGHFSGVMAGTSGGGAPSSAQLLEAMRARQQPLMAAAAAADVSGANPASPGSSSPGLGRTDSGGMAGPSGPGGENSDEAALLLTRIISFLHTKGGAAATDVLIGAFQVDVPQSKVPLFKYLLRQAATLQKVNGVGLWKLKKEFLQDKPDSNTPAS